MLRKQLSTGIFTWKMVRNGGILIWTTSEPNKCKILIDNAFKALHRKVKRSLRDLILSVCTKTDKAQNKLNISYFKWFYRALQYGLNIALLALRLLILNILAPFVLVSEIWKQEKHSIAQQLQLPVFQRLRFQYNGLKTTAHISPHNERKYWLSTS